jgi:hypothetical protein
LVWTSAVVTTGHLHPSLIFEGKAGAYPIEASLSI